MPWHINNKNCVVKSDTGEVVKCHSSAKEAKDHLKALYANVDDVNKELGFFVAKEQNDDGSYNIHSISTVARADKEGETFTTKAMDFDIALAYRLGRFPEYRMFHKKSLGIGKVHKMYRVGDYAFEEGKSYTDPFSLAVCKDLLATNIGVWKNSRGFYVLEAFGGCPHCKSKLKVSYKHMIAGFYCPVCKSLATDYRGELLDTHFLKTMTFDITITDRPAVPWTGTIAFKNGENAMTKAQLRRKLKEAGIAEDVIEERLKLISGDVLKELGNDLPLATVLKEADLEDLVEEDEEVEEEVEEEQPKKKRSAKPATEEVLEMDDSIVEEIATQVTEKVKELLDGAVFEAEGLEGLATRTKEHESILDRLDALEDMLVAMKEAIDGLTEEDDRRIARKLKEAPRNGRLRIIRRAKEEMMDEEEEDSEDDEEMPMKKSKQQRRPAFPNFGNHVTKQPVAVVDGFGNKYSSLTDMVVGE